MIAIVDYGAGNLRSVVRAVQSQGANPSVTSSGADVDRADALILPGVGAAADTMAHLRQYDLVEPLCAYIASGRPFLGVCMGLQALLTGSEEGGWHACLDIVDGRVKRFSNDLIVPHMGWNQVDVRRDHPVFRDIPDHSFFYFVHSYYCAPASEDTIVATTAYGGDFPSVLGGGNWIATQFHPEKSGAAGLRVYKNFLTWAGVMLEPATR
ncbi:MAG: imidazole glycerol phosphate synthase subunit HisH [Chloroflexota bacterium]|nr:MAG: imidazole glycerol phosphate synthase subunit HisH [Chloroflexota bacterium]